MKMCYCSLKLFYSVIVLNLLVAQYHSRTVRRSNAPIKKSSGLQWSAPKSKGSGNVSIVILPQDNTANNSDFVVAINTDYKVFSEDTHLLSLMMNDSNIVPETDIQDMPLQLSDEIITTDLPHKIHSTRCSFKGTNTRYKPYTKIIQIPVKYNVKNTDKLVSNEKQDRIISGDKLQMPNKSLHKAQFYNINIKERTSEGVSRGEQTQMTTVDPNNKNKSKKITFRSNQKVEKDDISILNNKIQKANKISITLEMLNSPENESTNFQNLSQIPDVHVEKIRPLQVIKVYPYQNFSIGMNKSLKPSDIHETLNDTKILRLTDANIEAVNAHVNEVMNANFNKDSEGTLISENHADFDNSINRNHQNFLKDNNTQFYPQIHRVVSSEPTKVPNEYQRFDQPNDIPSHAPYKYFLTKQKSVDELKRINFKPENSKSVEPEVIVSPVLRTIDSIDLPVSQETNNLNNKPQYNNKNIYNFVLVIPTVPNELPENNPNTADAMLYLLNIAKQKTGKQPNDFVKKLLVDEEPNDSSNKETVFALSPDESMKNINPEELTSEKPQLGNLINYSSVNLTNTDFIPHMAYGNESVKRQTSNTFTKDESELKEQKPSLTINLYNKSNDNI